MSESKEEKRKEGLVVDVSFADIEFRIASALQSQSRFGRKIDTGRSPVLDGYERVPGHRFHLCDPRCTCPADVWWRCFQHWEDCPAAKKEQSRNVD